MDEIKPVELSKEQVEFLENQARIRRAIERFFVKPIHCERCDELTERNQSKSWCAKHMPVGPKTRWG